MSVKLLSILFSLICLIMVQKEFDSCSTVKGSRLQMLFKIGVLKISQYSQENTCVGVSF